MRIAIVTTDSREHYRDYGNPVPYFGAAPEALLQGFAQVPEVEVHVLSCVQARMKSPEKIAPNIFYHGLFVPKIGWMRTAYQGCIRAVRRKLREIRPDIVHGQGTERDCAADAVCSGFPSVLTIHGNMRLIARVNHVRPFSYGWLAAQLEKVTIPRARGVICITRYTREAVKDLARRTWIVPNAVDESFFNVQPQPRTDQPPLILCVGVVCQRKNQNAFIRALDPLARERRFEVRFLGQAVAGEPYDDEFLALVRERPWCVFAGLVDRTKLKAHFREATLLALPSLEDNCPMVVLEAMAAGVPAVAASVGGVPELIEEGRTGFFCDPLDAASMRQAVERALVNSSEARTVVHEARRQADERFHPKVIARRHVEIYREVLGTGS
jgi:glycosyltransferase involved in cell wall biosynthesis